MLFVLALILHVIAVVHWIGGVALVTTVLIPAIRRMAAPDARIALFETIENRFAAQARVSTLVVAATGVYMLNGLHAWPVMLSRQGWWLDAMVGLWALYSLMLFVIEPLFLHDWFIARARINPDSAFRTAELLHRVLLVISLLTVAAAVAGANGFSLG
jgi:uncharacterized membrane protein